MTSVAPMTAAARARLIRQARGKGSSPIAPPAARRTSGPATFAQEQLWFLDQLAPGSANYNVPFAFTLDGPVDADVLEATLTELARRHDSLRTRLELTADGLTQQVEDTLAAPFLSDDLADRADAEGEAWRRIRDAVARPFTLTDPPLWRAELYRIAPERHVLVWVASHAVADGWSIGLLMNELAVLYPWVRDGRPAPGPDEPRAQLLDYTLWQRDRVSGEVLDELYEYWDGALHDVTALDFPYDHPRPAHPTTRGRTATFQVDDDLAAALDRGARELEQTPFVVALAAYHALLARYCGHNDIAVGTPVAGRDRPGFDSVLGSLVNTVALRVDCSGNPTFGEFVDRVATVTRDALAHQELPFGKLVERLRPPRAGGYSPLLSTVFTYGSTPFADEPHRLGDVAMGFTGVSNDTVRFDFELALDRHDDGWSGRLEYAVDLIDAGSAEALCRRYIDTLRRGLAEPGTRLSELVPADERDPVEGTADDPRDDPSAVTINGTDLPPADAALVVRLPDPDHSDLALVQRSTTDEDRYVLGVPVRGVQAGVYDQDGALVPDGMAGTLTLRGDSGAARFPGRAVRLSSGAFAAVGRQVSAADEPADSAADDGADVEAVRALVTTAWQEALEVDSIGPDEDFFAAGGHSVLGAKLVARLRDELRCELSLIDFFQALTISELTNLLVSRGATVTDGAPPEPTADLIAEVEAMSDEQVRELLAEHAQ